MKLGACWAGCIFSFPFLNLLWCDIYLCWFIHQSLSTNSVTHYKYQFNDQTIIKFSSTSHQLFGHSFQFTQTMRVVDESAIPCCNCTPLGVRVPHFERRWLKGHNEFTVWFDYQPPLRSVWLFIDFQTIEILGKYISATSHSFSAGSRVWNRSCLVSSQNNCCVYLQSSQKLDCVSFKTALQPSSTTLNAMNW